MRRDASFTLYVATCISTLLIARCNANVNPFLQAGFQFEYNGPQQTVNIPITAQCETVLLRWGRGKMKGNAPIAPYFLQVFSSLSSSPFVIPAGSGPTFEWPVPFAPQTQYQICMYDSVGTSGGCQTVRTIVPSATPNVTCQNVTSLPTLSSSTSLDDLSGSAIQKPVINQCDTFSVTPTTGSPPFTLTISPSRHPPVNITATEKKPIVWTVALPEGFPFFASVTSSDGLSWSQGPLLVGGTGSSDCLSPGAVPKNTFTYSTVGSSLGSLVVGAVLGAAVMFLVSRCRQARQPVNKTGPPKISHPVLIPELSVNFSRHSQFQRPHPESMQYPPAPTPALSHHSLPYSPPRSPDRSNFLEHDPFAVSPPSRGQDQTPDARDSIIPFTDSSPSSSHFPLDVKSRRSHLSQTPSRTPSLRSYTTFASTSDFNQSSYAASSRNSQTPLMPPPSSLSSGGAQLGRAPTYRRAPPSHLSPPRELIMDDDSMIGAGDMPPQYMSSPAEAEISVSGGRPSITHP